jgi:hypothetical protein
MTITVEKSVIPLAQFNLKVHIERHSINVDPKITNLFKISVEQLEPIIEALNLRYKEIEKSEHPAAGYRLHFRMLAPDKRPLEIELDQLGERKNGEPLKLPSVPSSAEKCDFCAKKASNKYPIREDSGAKVIVSNQGNALSIPTRHYSHFFEMPLDAQVDVVMLAITALQTDTSGECTRATIYTNIGAGDNHGHQNYGHSHMHFETSTGRKTQT